MKGLITMCWKCRLKSMMPFKFLNSNWPQAYSVNWLILLSANSKAMSIIGKGLNKPVNVES